MNGAGVTLAPFTDLRDTTMRKIMKNPNRVIGEIELLSTHFGRVRFDQYNPTTVIIEKFDLSCGFNRSYARALIDLGLLYPELPPQDFYLSRGLRKYGEISDHYFEKGYGDKKYCKKGWAWYSLHIKRWKPDPSSMVADDNLLTAVEALYDALSTD
jgi:hypothetical protein